MSEIKERVANRALAHIVEHDGKHYYVDSVLTSDMGYETMVFSYLWFFQEVLNWHELYVERYETAEEMEKRHNEICNNLEMFLEGENAKNRRIHT